MNTCERKEVVVRRNFMIDPSQAQKDGGKGMVFPSLGGGTGGRKVSFIL